MLQILSEKLRKFIKLNERFVAERLLCNTKSIYDTVCKNDFALFPSKNSIVTNKSVQKIVSLQAERLLYANLYLACQSRDGDLDDFVMHENHLYLPSISDYGKLKKCLTKSDFLACVNSLA